MELADVTTVLQTGNVIFTSDDTREVLKRRIEGGLRARFNYPAHVQVFQMTKLRHIVDSSPFDGSDSQTHSYVVLFEDGLEKEVIAEARDLDDSYEEVAVGDGVLYWRVRKGSTLQTTFAKLLTRARFRDLHTSRNINTLRKIVI